MRCWFDLEFSSECLLRTKVPCVWLPTSQQGGKQLHASKHWHCIGSRSEEKRELDWPLFPAKGLFLCVTQGVGAAGWVVIL